MALYLEEVMDMLESNLDEIMKKLSSKEWAEFRQNMSRLAKKAEGISNLKELEDLTDELVELCVNYRYIEYLCERLAMDRRRPGAPKKLEKADIEDMINRLMTIEKKMTAQDKKDDNKRSHS